MAIIPGWQPLKAARASFIAVCLVDKPTFDTSSQAGQGREQVKRAHQDREGGNLEVRRGASTQGKPLVLLGD